jgi:membrane protease YdiL (CAAX protease family)
MAQRTPLAGIGSGARTGLLPEAGMAALGMALFALFSREPFPLSGLSMGGLGLTALAMARSFRSTEAVASIFGLARPGPATLIWAAGALGFSAVLSTVFRLWSGESGLPGGLGAFVIPAAAIGAAEELVYRGYLQGRLAPLGATIACVLAAGAHTAYKLALFALPPEGLGIRYATLGVWTFGVGVVLGLTRHGSGSVLPALSAHALFDILVYGERAHAPWWVW